MPKKSAFKYNSLSQSQRHFVNVNAFLGVDYSSKKFSVADGRAIDEMNYVYRDGSLQKRFGIEQIAQADPFKYLAIEDGDPSKHSDYASVNGVSFNGMWQFLAEDGQRHIVAHIGRLLYEITDIDNNMVSMKPFTFGVGTDAYGRNAYIAYEMEDFKSNAFVGGRKLWIFTGKKLMVLRFTNGGFLLYPVEDSDLAPIPVTTESITYKDSSVSERMSLNRPNLMTQWRTNKLASDTYVDDGKSVRTTRFWDYELDSDISPKNRKDLNSIRVTVERIKEK